MKESRRGRKKPPLRKERYLVTCGLCKKRFESITWAHLVYRHHLPRRGTFGSYRPHHASHYFLAGEVRQKQARAKRRWSRKRILAEIRRVKRSRHPLNLAAVERSHSGLVSAALRVFGSWGAALGAAGIRESDVRLHVSWTQDMIIQRIRERGVAGKPLNFGAMRKRTAKRGPRTGPFRPGLARRLIRLAHARDGPQTILGPSLQAS